MVDINLSEGAPIINDNVSLIIQQIDTLFDTAYREVHGAPYYGTRYDEFLYNMNMSNDAIAYQVECDLADINLFGFIPTVNVTILEGTINDIILISITLSKNDEVYEKTYKIQ